MIVAGLTGGIATGKSTVSKMFRDEGAVIIDADKIAHNVVKKGEPAWQQIRDYFGNEILLPDEEINRAYLGDIVFNDVAQKKVLNEIVHHFVLEKMAEELNHVEETRRDSTVILDVPLLIESGMHKGITSDVILVYIPERLQLERLIARDNISIADATARIKSQMPIDEKKNYAGIVIDNSKSIDETRKRTIEVFRTLTK
ncbi:MAG: dephospho-CoA kinase [Deltaproteobacteria bacterium]|nr:dephospho-CoA kinase [Deltaproteobacteria bacterium]